MYNQGFLFLTSSHFAYQIHLSLGLGRHTMHNKVYVCVFVKNDELGNMDFKNDTSVPRLDSYQERVNIQRPVRRLLH